MEVGWYLRFKPDAVLVFQVGHGAVQAALGALHTVSGWRAETTRYEDHAEIRFWRGAPDHGAPRREQPDASDGPAGPEGSGGPEGAGGGHHTGGRGKE